MSNKEGAGPALETRSFFCHMICRKCPGFREARGALFGSTTLTAFLFMETIMVMLHKSLSEQQLEMIVRQHYQFSPVFEFVRSVYGKKSHTMAAALEVFHNDIRKRFPEYSLWIDQTSRKPRSCRKKGQVLPGRFPGQSENLSTDRITTMLK